VCLCTPGFAIFELVQCQQLAKNATLHIAHSGITLALVEKLQGLAVFARVVSKSADDRFTAFCCCPR